MLFFVVRKYEVHLNRRVMYVYVSMYHTDAPLWPVSIRARKQKDRTQQLQGQRNIFISSSQVWYLTDKQHNQTMVDNMFNILFRIKVRWYFIYFLNIECLCTELCGPSGTSGVHKAPHPPSRRMWWQYLNNIHWLYNDVFSNNKTH